jgi:hypothetical protein
MDDQCDTLPDPELFAAFEQLFPQGFAGQDALQELAPEGWHKSPLLAVFHPSVEQVYQESLALHRNMLALRRPDDTSASRPEPTLAEIAANYREHAVEVEREVRELVGRCLWDIFSDNHDVVAADGRRLDLGSFRGSGDFIADLLNRQTATRQYDYMDFYLGTIWVNDRADLVPVYRMIFRRLRANGFDWVYQFPRIYAIDFRPLKEALEKKDEPEWLNYSPSESLAKEEEEKKRDRELAEFRESLDEDYREAVAKAQESPPPPTVHAYQDVYGAYPRGWPPEEA